MEPHSSSESVPVSRPPAVLLLGACFFLSGATGLVYQVVWLRMLGLVFGHTVYATTTVLVAFMAGLGLGSYLLARHVHRLRDLIAAYGWLEIGIGIYCAILPPPAGGGGDGLYRPPPRARPVLRGVQPGPVRPGGRDSPRAHHLHGRHLARARPGAVTGPGRPRTHHRRALRGEHVRRRRGRGAGRLCPASRAGESADPPHRGSRQPRRRCPRARLCPGPMRARAGHPRHGRRRGCPRSPVAPGPRRASHADRTGDLGRHLHDLRSGLDPGAGAHRGELHLCLHRDAPRVPDRDRGRQRGLLVDMGQPARRRAPSPRSRRRSGSARWARCSSTSSFPASSWRAFGGRIRRPRYSSSSSRSASAPSW